MLPIKPQGLFSWVLDHLMLPVMYLLQGTLRELPQRTHRWNNMHLSISDVHFLDDELLVSVEEDVGASPRWLAFLPIFHIPLFGGWNKYVVLTPAAPQDQWFVGWVAGDIAGVSTVSLTGSVRVLRGSSPVHFFGVNEHGSQIQLVRAGDGVVGRAEEAHRRIPLL